MKKAKKETVRETAEMESGTVSATSASGLTCAVAGEALRQIHWMAGQACMPVITVLQHMVDSEAEDLHQHMEIKSGRLDDLVRSLDYQDDWERYELALQNVRNLDRKFKEAWRRELISEMRLVHLADEMAIYRHPTGQLYLRDRIGEADESLKPVTPKTARDRLIDACAPELVQMLAVESQ